MVLFRVRSVFSGIFIIILVHYGSPQCVKSTSCTCIREDGMGYDLTSLKNKTLFIKDRINVKFQPCKNVNLTFAETESQKSECDSTSICRLNSKNESINLGKVEESMWELPKDKEVQLTFHHTLPNKTDMYETKIILVCCQSCKTSSLEFDSSDKTKNNFKFVSPISCLRRLKSQELSTGSILVILLCVFSAVYLIGGALALRIFRGAIGLEMIPNYDFWSNLPGLVRDGVTFTLSGCTAFTYERI